MQNLYIYHVYFSMHNGYTPQSNLCVLHRARLRRGFASPSSLRNNLGVEAADERANAAAQSKMDAVERSYPQETRRTARLDRGLPSRHGQGSVERVLVVVWERRASAGGAFLPAGSSGGELCRPFGTGWMGGGEGPVAEEGQKGH